MITMEQAEESVNRRLGGLIPDGESHQMHDVSAAALTCSGTNILGAELVERLTADTLETLMRTATSGDMQGAVAGSLIRIFWLGYAFGEAGDDA